MDSLAIFPVMLTQPPTLVVGEWYLKGFADAYGAHWAVVPNGPAGEQYQRGYALGLAAVRDEFFAALNRIPRQQALTADISYCA